MKICPTCGAQLNDDAVFCAACGNPVPATVEAAPQADGFAPAATAQGINDDTKKLIVIIGAVVAALVLIIVLFTTVFSANAAAKRTVKARFRAMNSRNATKLVKLEYPKPLLEYAEDEWNEDKDDLIENFEDSFEIKDKKFGDDWKIKDIKIKKVKELKDDDFEDLQDWYDDACDMKITDARIVKVDYTIEGEDDEDSYKNSEFVVYKYKGKWYID